MSNFLVSGAGGFVGKALVARLRGDGHRVTALMRSPVEGEESGVDVLHAENDFIGLAERWPTDVRCDYAIHLAARVHVMNEAAEDAMARYRETNVAGALRFAAAAKRSGARRLVFLSSIKAMGDREPGHPWTERDIPVPDDPYGISKLEAERALQAYCEREGMSFVAIRPPLVYGPGVRANFLQLMSVVARRFPLPLASVDARRSMIFLDNLVDAIVCCAVHPGAAGKVFNVCDDQDQTVAEIASIIGAGMERHARLLPFPPAWLSALARLAGKTAQADRLLRPLRLDNRSIIETLGWRPQISSIEGLRRTAIWYRHNFLSNR